MCGAWMFLLSFWGAALLGVCISNLEERGGCVGGRRCRLCVKLLGGRLFVAMVGSVVWWGVVVIFVLIIGSVVWRVFLFCCG